MPPDSARLVWITREQRDDLTDEDIDVVLDARDELAATFNAAPEPVERRRCAYHYAEAVSERAQSCWKARERRDYRNCSLVTVWEMTAAPPEEA